MPNMSFANNAASLLASGISNSATSLSVTAGSGALFPVLTGSKYFYCTLANAAGAIEIIKVTARSSDTFTMTRGQDGTTALAWNANDKVELRLVAANLNDLVKADEQNTFTQTQTFNGLVTNNIGTVSGPWTTAGRPSSPTVGQSGFNTSTGKQEVWNAVTSTWVSSGGATGGADNDVFYENSLTVTSNYTITSGKSAMSTGPITIASGKAVTIPSGSRWVIL